MQRYASGRHLANAGELFTIMGKEEVKPEAKKPHKIRWLPIVMACCCILALTAVGKGFLYLDTEIGTVQSSVRSTVKDLNTLRAQVTAGDPKERLAAVTTEIEDLKATNMELRAEVERIREVVGTLKAKKKQRCFRTTKAQMTARVKKITPRNFVLREYVVSSQRKLST